MPNTYTQIYIHFVFATRYRMPSIDTSFQEDLYHYIAGICEEQKCFVHAIGGTDDHIHLLIGLRPTIAFSTFAQIVKTNSARFANRIPWLTRRFEWQEGYEAFSVSKSMRDKVREYIKNQAEHHQKYSFIDEYKGLLTKHKIDYDERYLFEECKD